MERAVKPSLHADEQRGYSAPMQSRNEEGEAAELNVLATVPTSNQRYTEQPLKIIDWTPNTHTIITHRITQKLPMGNVSHRKNTLHMSRSIMLHALLTED